MDRDGLRLASRGFEALSVDFDPDRGIPAGRNWERELYAQIGRRVPRRNYLGAWHSTPWSRCPSGSWSGRPMRSERLGETLLPKKIALPVFCSDPLSSNTYATEEILLVLGLGGLALLHLTWPSRVT